MHLLEDAVLRVLHQLALEEETYVRTAVIAGRLGLLKQLTDPGNSTYASTVVLAICRGLRHRVLVRMGGPEVVVRHWDQTTGWMTGAGEC
ncbi:MAG: hypothetical protein F4W95_07365 [Chloroflexi bacterium]|nr:hypothetical protein [Chloroflexota bacterium]MYD48290.1 hypothetical protein [Chloroflexota bacterium]